MLCRAKLQLSPINTQGEENEETLFHAGGFSRSFAIAARGQGALPLKLAQTLTLPGDIKGNFDHFLASTLKAIGCSLLPKATKQCWSLN